jgi:hypothetical protein
MLAGIGLEAVGRTAVKGLVSSVSNRLVALASKGLVAMDWIATKESTSNLGNGSWSGD